jgi:hypothetical protein
VAAPVSRGQDAYEAGLRAGYAHGYDIGRAHARADLEIELARDAEIERARLDGPDRAELIARGHIPIDHTRPPALPVRLWRAEDWAKADARDLPTTEYGHAQWQQALAAGRVPRHLAEAYAEAHPERSASGPRATAAELAEHVCREVAESGRAVDAARNRVERTRTVSPSRQTPELPAQSRVAAAAGLERELGR